MQINNVSYQRNIAFEARIPKARKEIIMQAVKSISDAQLINKGRPSFNIYRGLLAIGTLGEAAATAYALSRLDFLGATFAGLIGYGLLGKTSESIHKAAMKKLPELLFEMKKRDLNSEEKLYGIKKFLSKSGDFLATPLAKLTEFEKIKKMVE